MKEPQIPDNEVERLQALRLLAVPDTPPEPRFDRITHIAQNLFDLEKIALGWMTFNMTSLPLAAVLTEAIEVNQSSAMRFNVSLRLRCSLDAWVHVNADNDHLIQVLTNLIANAAKFSSPGAVV